MKNFYAWCRNKVEYGSTFLESQKYCKILVCCYMPPKVTRWPRGKCFQLQIMRSWVRIPQEVKIISWLFCALCHKTFHNHRCGLSLTWVTCGKAKFCLRMVKWFFPGFPGFCPPLMNDWLDMWNILERAIKPKFKKKKKKKEKKKRELFSGKNKKSTNLLSADFAQIVLKIMCLLFLSCR